MPRKTTLVFERLSIVRNYQFIHQLSKESEFCMRPDMAKILVERPRWGSHFKSPNDTAKWQSIPMDEWPRRGRMGMTEKRLSETLAPLQRYLMSNVGRPWDKIYSEICRYIDRNNAVQAHILQHLWGYVAVDVEIIDGRIVEKYQGRYHFGREPELYVDPRTGILRKNKRNRPRFSYWSLRPAPRFMKIGHNKFIAKLNGVWYELATSPFPADPSEHWFDVAAKFCERGNSPHYYGEEVYAVSKRQLKVKEIKAMGLRKEERMLPNIVR